MTNLIEARGEVLARFRQWAVGEDGIRAALLVGSMARATEANPADEWSDMDIIIVARHPARYLQSADWLANMGEVWLTFLESTGSGSGTERRVLFAGGVDVDFPVVSVGMMRGLGSVLRLMRFSPYVKLLLPKSLRNSVNEFFVTGRRGIKIVLDKDGLFGGLNGFQFPPAPLYLPDETAYANLVHDFLYHCVLAAKKLRRGELLYAKGNADGYLKGYIVELARWQARADGRDVWHETRFFEQWADPALVAAMANVYAQYDRTDIVRAIFASLDLFEQTAQNYAVRRGFRYPSEAAAHTRELLEKLLNKVE